MKHLFFVLLMCSTLINLSAQNTKDGDRTSGQSVENSDKDFVMKAADAGLAEVMKGQLAQAQGNSQSVKDYGMMMEKDHTKANTELKQLATKNNLVLPTTLSAAHQKDYDALKQKSGDEFDKAFMKQMIKDHKAVIALFEDEAKNGKNAELKSWAADTLPKLKSHLKHAEGIHKP